MTLKERSKVKSDTTKGFAACGFLNIDCTLQISRSNNKQDKATFVKNVNVGGGNGSNSNTTNESTLTKITQRLSPKLVKLSWEFEKSIFNSICDREETVNLGRQASAHTHTRAPSKNTFLNQPLIIVDLSWKIESYDYNTARVRRFWKIKKKIEKRLWWPFCLWEWAQKYCNLRYLGA